MIGFNRLGSYGRFGNQMFQYAALRGIAANNNLDWCIPPKDTPSCDNYGLFDAFKLKNLKAIKFEFRFNKIFSINKYNDLLLLNSTSSST